MHVVIIGKEAGKPMSRIIVLVGSVRKGGNTDLLAQAFAESAGKNHEVELVSVADYSVHPCIGCNSCYSSEGIVAFRMMICGRSMTS